MHKAVIDTSVLIICEKIGILSLLNLLFDPIICPSQVIREYGATPQKLEISDCYNKQIFSLLSSDLNLGAGEAAAISLSFSLGSWLLIDDLRGRKIARDMGIPIMGTIGIIGKLRAQGLINNAYDKGCEMKEKGYWIAEELLQQLLSLDNGKGKR